MKNLRFFIIPMFFLSSSGWHKTDAPKKSDKPERVSFRLVNLKHTYLDLLSLHLYISTFWQRRQTKLEAIYVRFIFPTPNFISGIIIRITDTSNWDI